MEPIYKVFRLEVIIILHIEVKILYLSRMELDRKITILFLAVIVWIPRFLYVAAERK
jgi:hypothetical protein